MASRRRIYPLFLPHAGCPFRCVYCNQRAVTRASLESKNPIAHFHAHFPALLREAGESGRPGEIAFYSGTFTALPRPTLRTLLEEITPWVIKGVFTGIRFSTRPDRMAEEVCRLLGDYPVTTVELGVQSLSDEVLRQTRRGYDVETVVETAQRVHAHGWRLGVQLMAGLPGETGAGFRSSVLTTLELTPDLVRVYPTLVLKDTELAEWSHAGRYRPLSLEDAIERCAFALARFREAGIEVARLGLHADPELDKPGAVLAGPHDPAFGHRVRARIWRRRVDVRLEELDPTGRSVILHVPARRVSEVLGWKRENVDHWRQRFGLSEVDIRQETEFADEQLGVEIP